MKREHLKYQAKQSKSPLIPHNKLLYKRILPNNSLLIPQRKENLFINIQNDNNVNNVNKTLKKLPSVKIDKHSIKTQQYNLKDFPKFKHSKHPSLNIIKGSIGNNSKSKSPNNNIISKSVLNFFKIENKNQETPSSQNIIIPTSTYVNTLNISFRDDLQTISYCKEDANKKKEAANVVVYKNTKIKKEDKLNHCIYKSNIDMRRSKAIKKKNNNNNNNKFIDKKNNCKSPSKSTNKKHNSFEMLFDNNQNKQIKKNKKKKDLSFQLFRELSGNQKYKNAENSAITKNNKIKKIFKINNTKNKPNPNRSNKNKKQNLQKLRYINDNNTISFSKANISINEFSPLKNRRYYNQLSVPRKFNDSYHKKSPNPLNLNNTLNTKLKTPKKTKNFIYLDDLPNEDIPPITSQKATDNNNIPSKNNIIVNKITNITNIFGRNFHNNSKSFSSFFSLPSITEPSLKFPFNSMEKVTSFNEDSHLSIKIISTFGKAKYFSIKSITLYDKQSKAIKISFMIYSNKLISSSKEISSAIFLNSNLHIYYKKNSRFDDVKTICIVNGEINGLKEVEIYKNNSLLMWKGVIPNKSKEFYINLDMMEIEIFSNSEDSGDIIENNNSPINQKNKLLMNKDIKEEKFESILHDESLRMTLFNKNKKKNINNYVKLRKIKIELIENYGNKKYIGLTGIDLLKGNKTIDIIKANKILILQKKNNINKEEKYIDDTIFNKKNQTIDESMMWLINNTNPSIEIAFNEEIKITALRIWNYNSPKHLDKCTKSINIYIDDIKYTNESIILHQGIGDDLIDYSQIIKFPYNAKKYSDEELEPFNQIKYASVLYNQNYETPYLPTGFIFKFILLSNWGDDEYIALEEIKLFDQLGREIKKANKSSKVHSFSSNDVYNEKKNQSAFKERRRGYFSKYYNIQKSEGDYKTKHSVKLTEKNMRKRNVIYYIYNEPICVSFIRIKNYKNEWRQGVKKIIIFCDNNIIFNGEIHKYNIINNGYTSVLFTCDLNITKDIKESEICGYHEDLMNEIENLYLINNETERGRLFKSNRVKEVKYDKGISLIPY